MSTPKEIFLSTTFVNRTKLAEAFEAAGMLWQDCHMSGMPADSWRFRVNNVTSNPYPTRDEAIRALCAAARLRTV